jgi:hypothetical protein
VTAVIPQGGLSAWEEPDPARAPVATAEAGLEVKVLEGAGDWARVEFANGWSAWVDGRALTRPRKSNRVIEYLPGAGAALIAIGSFLPWLRAGGTSISAWDIPLPTLFTHDASTSGVKVGLLLLIPLVALVPYFTHKPIRPLAYAGLAGLATYTAMAGAMLTDDPVPDAGIGLAVTYLGAVALTGSTLFRRNTRAA